MERILIVARLGVALLSGFLATSCFNAEPKILGRMNKLDFSTLDNGSQSQFKFNFAILNGSVAYLQGAATAKSNLIGVCNLAGTACACNFFDASGTLLYTSKSSEMSYEEPGNYFRCTYSGSSAIANVASVVMKNQTGSISSDSLAIKTVPSGGVAGTLTLSDLIGTDVDINRVRTVYRYACGYNFLQKKGTTSAGFDCSLPTTTDPVNDPVICKAGGVNYQNFCILKAKFPFYLYADNYSSNMASKMADKLYNNGAMICGLQITQVDCTGKDTDSDVVTKKFGLYSQLSGMWQTSVSLPVGPDQSATSYGFAAKTSTAAAYLGECPPGLLPQVFYTVAVDTTDIKPSHNFVSGQISTEISAPTTIPAAFEIDQLNSTGTAVPADGTCTGTACTLPINRVANVKAAQTYSSAGQTTFCVIPPELLSQ